MIEATISQFGNSLGINDLSLNEDGVVQLSFDSLGELFMEKVRDDILIYLLKKVEYSSSKLFWNALSLCYAQETYPFPVNAIYSVDNQIGFAIRHKENNFTLQSINQSIDFLTNLHQRLFNMS